MDMKSTLFADDVVDDEVTVDDIDDSVFELGDVTEADFNVLAAVRIY